MQLLRFFLQYVYSLPSAFLFLLIVKHFLPVPGRWRQIVLTIAAMTIVNPIIWIGDTFNILLVAVVIFAAIPLLCKGLVLARFSVSLLLFNVVISAAAILSSLRPPLDAYIQVFFLLLWLCIYFFVRHFVEPAATQSIRKTLWLLLNGLSLFPFGVTVVVVAFSKYTRAYVNADEFKDTLVIGNEGVLLAILTLSAVYAVGLLLCVALLARQEKLEQQEVLWAVRQQHYVSLEQNQLQVRRLRHDMANHLSAMAGMDNQRLREYLLQLISTPAIEGGRCFCENDIVNAVLAGKLSVAEQEGIRCEFQVVIPQKLSVSDVDLCAIFSNCLDNAIEACRKCPPDSRKIFLTAKADKGIFALRLKNSMAGTIVTKGGDFVTSKSDKQNHGLGMAEIRDIVQQQHGILRFSQELDVFQMQLSIPVLQ